MLWFFLKVCCNLTSKVISRYEAEGEKRESNDVNVMRGEALLNSNALILAEFFVDIL